MSQPVGLVRRPRELSYPTRQSSLDDPSKPSPRRPQQAATLTEQTLDYLHTALHPDAATAAPGHPAAGPN